MKRNSVYKIEEGTEAIQTLNQSPHEIKDLIIQVLEDTKGQDIKALSLKGKTTIADYLVIVSGTSDRHLFSMAQKVCEKLSEIGMKGLKIEGSSGSEWLLIDANDVIVHLFKPDTREMYDLETMWSGDFERLLAQVKSEKS